MPRKKLPPKFKYTIRRNGILYVKYPVENLKYPVWRICREETQTAVNEIIEEIENDRLKVLRASEVPENCQRFFDYYLDRVKDRVTERTLQNRKTVIRLYLTPVLGEMDISQIKPKHLSEAYRKMADAGLSAETIKKAHTVASNAFKEAVILESIQINPASGGVVRPLGKASEPRNISMSKVEAQRFLVECRKSANGIIFEFALETGTRPGEYLALRWTDLDLTGQKVEISRALAYRSAGGGVRSEHGCFGFNGFIRGVPQFATQIDSFDFALCKSE